MRSSDEDRQAWHTEARERDEAYLALGPVDDCETDDPWHPWRGSVDPVIADEVAAKRRDDV